MSAALGFESQVLHHLPWPGGGESIPAHLSIRQQQTDRLIGGRWKCKSSWRDQTRVASWFHATIE